MPEYIKHPDVPSHTEALYESETYHTAGGTAKKFLLESDSNSTPAAADMTPISKDWAASHTALVAGAHGATVTPAAGKIPVADAFGKLVGWVSTFGLAGSLSIFVASSTASAAEKAMATPDYTCDGTADNVQIQAAIDAV